MLQKVFLVCTDSGGVRESGISILAVLPSYGSKQIHINRSKQSPLVSTISATKLQKLSRSEFPSVTLFRNQNKAHVYVCVLFSLCWYSCIYLYVHSAIVCERHGKTVIYFKFPVIIFNQSFCFPLTFRKGFKCTF